MLQLQRLCASPILVGQVGRCRNFRLQLRFLVASTVFILATMSAAYVGGLLSQG